MIIGRILRLSAAVALVAVLAQPSSEYDRYASKLSDVMHWRPGEVIAEIGSGEGEMSFFAAARVGATGKVYTTELDDQKIAHLQTEVKRRHLQNVTVIKADSIQTNLPDDCCDAIYMRRVYHHFKDPLKTDEAILHDLKRGGLLAVIDFAPRGGLAPIDGAPKTHGSGHGISKDVLLKELKSAGFEIANDHVEWPDDGDYCVLARRPATGP